MDITSIATAASANSATQLQDAVQLTVLKKAIDLQSAGALALLQAVPTPVPAPATGSVGGIVDTFA